MNLGSRLRQLRAARGLSQIDLAKRLQIANSTLSLYESNDRFPDKEMLNRIADFFNVSVDYLLGRTDDPRPVEEITKENINRITEALEEHPADRELLEFWKEMKERPDLFLLFKQVRPLSNDDIRRVIRIIKAIEYEESQES